MATEAQLWERMGKDIIASPDNDELRLQFAAALEEGDSVDENSHDRARFIHLQLALALMSPNDSEWMRLATEADSLLLKHEQEWIPKWYLEAEVRDPEFHRGFVECVTVSYSKVQDYHSKIFTQSPIRHLDFTDLWSPDLLHLLLYQLEQDGHLQRMISLRLDGQELEDQHIEFLNRPALSKLRWLSLAHNEIGYKGALALTQENLSGLEFVDLHGNPFDPVEQLSFDQGVVIDRSSDHVRGKFPEVGWLRR